jgi:hypothetical protein
MGVNLRTLVWLVLGRNLEPKPRRVKRRGPVRDAGYREWIDPDAVLRGLRVAVAG